MSVEAINWALNDAPAVPPQLVAVLIGLANHAGPDGRNAFAAQARLARYARKSDRAVRNDLKELLKLGLIRISENQGAAAHIRADVRPVVYDLALEKTNATSGTVVPPGSTVPAVNGDESGQGGSASGSTVPGGTTLPPGSTASNARKRTSDKPTTNQKKTSSSSSPAPRKRGAQAEPIDDDELDPETAGRQKLAAEIVQWWWDQQSPKPAGGSRAFFAYRNAVMKLLAVGWEPKAVASAARAVGSPITVPRMEMELNRAQRLASNSAAPAPAESPASTLPPWCGECGGGGAAARVNPKFRTDTGHPAGTPCPRCHPDTQKATTP